MATAPAARKARAAAPACTLALALAAAALAAGGDGDGDGGGLAGAQHGGWPAAWAQAGEPILTVDTAGDVYDHGDTIVIHGHVRVVVDDTPVLVTVFHTDGEGNPVKRIHIAQVDVAQDGSYTDIIYTSSEAWPAGEYRAEAHYSVHGSVETSFIITAPGTVESTSFHVVDAGSSGTFDVPYTIVGGQLGSMRINPDSLGMSVFIEEAGRGGGSLTLELPRRYIDARTAGCEGGDELFIILVDGAQTPYEKISDMSDKRVVKVPFREGDGHVEVIGTCVVPEFGAAAAAAMAAALAAAVAAAAALSRRSGGAGLGIGAGLRA